MRTGIGKLFFRGQDPTITEDPPEVLWAYDGKNPPAIVTENGVGVGVASVVQEFKGKVYFCSQNSGNGKELWSYDGNTAAMVDDSFPGNDGGGNPGSGCQFYDDVAVFNGKLYYPGMSADHGIELWSYNGVNPPAMVQDINPGAGNRYEDPWIELDSDPSDFIEFQGKLFFGANKAGGGWADYERRLFSLDGTGTATEVALTDQLQVAQGADIRDRPVVYQNKLYFAAQHASDEGKTIWSYDGTNLPSRIGLDGTVTISSDPYLTVLNDLLVFFADDEVHGKELWSYDGTNPPSMVADLWIGDDDGAKRDFDPAVYHGRVYFHCASEETRRYGNICSFDGTNAPDYVRYLQQPFSINPKQLTAFDGALYFHGKDGPGPQDGDHPTGDELCWLTTPAPVLEGDPHVFDAFGVHVADFKGEDHGVYNILSSAKLSANALFVQKDYVAPGPMHRLVHGSFVTEVYLVIGTDDGRTVRIGFSAARAIFLNVGEGNAPMAKWRAPVQLAFGNITVSLLERTVEVTTPEWSFSASSQKKDAIIAAGNTCSKGKCILNLNLRPLVDVGHAKVAPHGLLGQAYDGDDVSVIGAIDEYRGAEITTKAMAEGAIEGVAADYKMAGKFATDFAFSRWGKTEAAPRDVSKLMGKKIKHDTSVNQVSKFF
jgi:ELWxxDGT repeat protein